VFRGRCDTGRRFFNHLQRRQISVNFGELRPRVRIWISTDVAIDIDYQPGLACRIPSVIAPLVGRPVHQNGSLAAPGDAPLESLIVDKTLPMIVIDERQERSSGFHGRHYDRADRVDRNASELAENDAMCGSFPSVTGQKQVT